LGFPIRLQIASPATPQQGEGGRGCRQFQVVLFSGILAIARDSAFGVTCPSNPATTAAYALSILGHYCRHCASAGPASPSVPFDANYLPHNILSQFHYSHQLPISTLETLVDALEKLLEQSAETEKNELAQIER
jgi:hypothetical protein